MSGEQGKKQEHCLNCEAPDVGRYCASCGQRRGLHPRSLRVASAEVLGNVFSYDNRVWRSVVLLLVRPGSLTKAWCEGRRTSYFDPLRMFLFLGVLVFLAPDTLIIEEFEGPAGWELPADPDAGFMDRLQVGAQRIGQLKDVPPEQVGRLLNRLAVDYMLVYMTFGMLIMALLMRLIHRRSFLVEHLVFALHYASFISLTNLILRLVFPDIGNTTAENYTMFSLQITYMVIAYQVLFAKPTLLGRVLAVPWSLVAFLGFLFTYAQTAQLFLALELMPPPA